MEEDELLGVKKKKTEVTKGTLHEYKMLAA
jgi:hypothetical protein